jgi:hypothetical protein
MWEMFDFGHVKSHKELKESLQALIKAADEPTHPTPCSESHQGSQQIAVTG